MKFEWYVMKAKDFPENFKTGIAKSAEATDGAVTYYKVSAINKEGRVIASTYAMIFNHEIFKRTIEVSLLEYVKEKA